MRHYIGLIRKQAASDYGVSFPDFPGVVTAGTTMDDAAAMAEEALTLHVEGLVEDGEAIPESSSLDDIMADPENKDAVAILRVGLKTYAPKCIRVNVTLPEDILDKIDRLANRHGLARSGLLARAAKRELEALPEHPARPSKSPPTRRKGHRVRSRHRETVD